MISRSHNKVNMKNIIILFSVLLFSVKTFSQNTTIDSLNNLLSLANEDHEKVELLIELGKKYCKHNLTALDSLSLELENISTTLKSKKGLAFAFYFRAFNKTQVLRAHDLSSTLLDTAIIYMPSVKSNKFNGLVYLLQGQNAQAVDKYDMSIKYYKKARVEFTTLDDKKYEVIAVINTANLLRDQVKYTEAIEIYLDVLRKIEGVDEYLSAKIYSNIAITYGRMKDKEKAIKYYEKAYAVYLRKGNDVDQARLLLNSAKLYPPQIAIDKLSKAKEIYEKKKFNNSLGKVSNQLGLLYKREGEYHKAIESFKKAIDLKKEKSRTSSYINLSITYQLTENYPEAITALEKAHGIAIKYNFLQRLPDIYLTISELEESIGNDNKALVFYKNYDVIKDSILNIEKEKFILNLEEKYQNEKLEQDKIILQKDQKIAEARHKRLLIGLAVFLLLFPFVIWFAIRENKRKRNEEQLNERLTQQNKLVESANSLLAQKNQEILHRAKNHLTMLSVFMKQEARRINDPQAKTALLETENRLQAISMIDRKLNSNQAMKIEINKYLSELTTYIKQTFPENGKNINLVSNIESIIVNPEEAVWIGLIINELMTNSFKYAFANTVRPEIEINLSKKMDQELKMTYRDNGSGLLKEKDTQSTKSFGSQLIHNFTEQMNGRIHKENNKGLVYSFQFNVPTIADAKLV